MSVKSLVHPTLDMADFFEVEPPSDQKFNEQLSRKIPHALYSGLKFIQKLNPKYFASVYTNVMNMPLRFVCTHKATELGGLAMAFRETFFVWGNRVVDLGSATLALLKENKTSYGGDSGARSFSYALADSNAAYGNQVIFHEVLHHVAGDPDSMTYHNSDVLVTGGLGDIVYACSDLAFPYDDKVETNDKYVLFFFSSNEAKLQSLKTSLAYPLRNILHNVSYQKCMTCSGYSNEKDALERFRVTKNCEGYPVLDETKLILTSEQKAKIQKRIFELEQLIEQYRN